MRGPAWALGWEFWRHGGPQLALACPASLLLPSLLFGHPEMRGIEGGAEMVVLGRALHLTFLIIAIPLTTYAAFMAAGDARQKYALPLNSLRIVAPMLAQAVTAVIAVNVLGSWAMNTLFHAQWNVLEPTLVFAAVFCASFAVFWPLSLPEVLRRGLAMLVSALLTMAAVWLVVRHSIDRPERWIELSPLEYGLAILMICGAAPLAVWNFGRARHGGDADLFLLAQRIWERLVDWAPTRESFRGAARAEAWYEWREKGIVLPIAVAVLAAAIALLVLSLTSTVRKVDDGTSLLNASAWLVMVCFAFGFFMGCAGPRGTIRAFKASRPLTDAQLADSVLGNAARSVLTAWLIWTSVIVLVSACYLAAGRPVELTLATLLVWVGMMLASWAACANAAVLMLLRQWLATTIVISIVVVPISASFLVSLLAPRLVDPRVAAILFWSTMAGLLAVAALVVSLSYRLRLISLRRLALVAGLTAITFGLSWSARLDSAHTPGQLAALAGLMLVAAAYAWLPLGAAPLAVWWNRHR